MTLDRIICDGKDIALDANVYTWHETGLCFDYCRIKRKRTSFSVLHWTGGEGDANQVFQTLKTHTSALGKPEPLSVHFVIETDGDLYQFCDASMFCAHAAGVNDRSVGIEIVNRGDSLTAGTRDVARPLVTEMIHSQCCTYAAFTPAQVRTALVLTETLCRVYALPMRVPLRGEDVFPGELPAIQLQLFRGVIGHLHVKRGKRDPGLSLLRAIAARGAAQTNLRV